MPGTAPLVRLFVSSTFLDFQAERNVLHTRVFPRLRELCAERAIRFQPIDLRWGISDAAAAGQLTLPLCLEEIARCQRAGRRPSFLALIGDRYGWRPPPAAIPASELERLIDALDDERHAKVVREWYRRDDNARPPEYRLRPRHGTWRHDHAWQPVESALVVALRAAARRAGLDDPALLKYEASATEQEIVRAVLGPGGDPAGALCVVRRRTSADSPDPAGSEDAAHASGRLRAVTERLVRACGDRVWRYDVADAADPAYLARFAADVLAGLERAILDGAGASDLAPGPAREAEAHAAFAAERRAGFVGRRAEIDALLERVDRGAPHPIVVVGPSGSGKSALMARLEDAIRARGNRRVVARFAGATPICSTWRGLLASLAGELTPESGTAPAARAGEPIDEAMARLVRTWPSDRPLVMLIDGADQLGGAGSASGPDDVLAWLPRPLPAGVCVVVSAASDRLAPLEALATEGDRVEIAGLLEDDAGLLLESWLGEGGRTIQPVQRAAVLAAPESGLPLYLRLAADACARWASYDAPARLAPDLPGLVRQRLDHLVEPEMHGEMFVSRALGYLACSRTGLAEDELLDLLSADGAVGAELARTAHHALPDGRVPAVLWARLYQDLHATLTERLVDGDGVLAFYHRQIEEGVRARFLADDAAPELLHARLADHFRERPGMRSLAERPYQEATAGRWTAFRDTMTSVGYLIARVRAHGASPTIEDFGLAALARRGGGASADTAGDAEALERVRRAVELSAHAIDRDPRQLRTHLLARLAETTSGTVARLRREIEVGGADAWIAPLRVSLASADSTLVRSMTAHATGLVALAVDTSGRTLVTGDDEGRLQVWSVSSGTLRRSFAGAEGAALRWLRAGPDARAVAAGDADAARLWDAEAGIALAEVATSGPPLASSRDGRWLALAPEDGGLALWDLGAARADAIRRLPERRMVTGCFTRDGYACVVGDVEGNVLVVPVVASRDAPTGAARTWSPGPRAWPAGSMAREIHPGADARTILLTLVLPQREEDRYTSKEELRLALLDVETGAVTWRPFRALTAAWCSPDGGLALVRRPRRRQRPLPASEPSGPPPSALAAIDLETRAERWSRKDDLVDTRVLAWSPDGAHALVLQTEFPDIYYGMPVPHRIGWIDLASGARVGALLVDVEANHREPHVIAGDAGPFGTWCVWDDTARFTAPGGSPWPPLVTPGARIVGVSPAQDGRYVATASADGMIRVWNPAAAAGAGGTITGAPIRAVARATERSVVIVRASAVERLAVESWTAEGARDAAIPSFTSQIGLSAVSANGGWVAYLEQATTFAAHQEMYLWPMEMLVVWDVAGSVRVDSFATKLAGGEQIDCIRLAVADDGRRVALGIAGRDESWRVALWEVGAREAAGDIGTRGVALGALAITPDGSRIASGWHDGEIVVIPLPAKRWRTAPEQRPRSRIDAGAPVRALAWAPGARQLAWACEDDSIAVAQVGVRGAIAGPTRFSGEADRLVFSADGRLLLAVGAELAWHRVPTGEIVARLALDAPFVDAAVLGDGVVVAGDRLGGLHLLQLREPPPA
jgi:WD40 repeat protein